MRNLALISLLTVVASTAQVVAPRSSTPPRISAPVQKQANLTTAQIAKKVSPSVVVIQGKTGSGDLLGSGFIISKDGRIVTNLHVIREMKIASIQLTNGEIFDSVSVLATDERRDLAIVQIPGFNLPVLDLGDSDGVTIGEPTVIVGSPRGLEGTVTAGILSSVRDSGDGFKVLQTDAAVNPGNSGGPLVNNKGQVIGVVSFKLRSAEGLNFAIPINYVRGLLNALQGPMSLEQMRQHLSTATAAQGQQQKRPPSNNQPKEPISVSELRLGSTLSEVRTQTPLESCSNDPNHESTCVTPVRLADLVLNARLTFANDLLVRVSCFFPESALDGFRKLLVERYGSPHWTDFSTMQRVWTRNGTEIILFESFGPKVCFFATILKSYQAELKAKDANADLQNSEAASLQETLDWLKGKLALSTYHINQRIGDHIGESTVQASPVTFDSCTLVFDEIDNTSIPTSNGYQSQLTTRFTVPLGSVTGGAAKKVGKEYLNSTENIEKWAVVIGTGSKVVLREIHLTSSMLWSPLPDLPKMRTKGDDTTKRESADNAYLIFDDETLARRILEAFRHMAELCRGKEAF